MLAPFVPRAVHLAAELDNGIAESVLDQQFTKVVEVRIVVAGRCRDESRETAPRSVSRRTFLGDRASETLRAAQLP